MAAGDKLLLDNTSGDFLLLDNSSGDVLLLEPAATGGGGANIEIIGLYYRELLSGSKRIE